MREDLTILIVLLLLVVVAFMSGCASKFSKIKFGDNEIYVMPQHECAISGGPVQFSVRCTEK